eukprot:9210569-Alexandrium_andersonii.AAC.1
MDPLVHVVVMRAPFGERGTSALSCGHASRPRGKSAASGATRGARREPRPNCTSHPGSGPPVMDQGPSPCFLTPWP